MGWCIQCNPANTTLWHNIDLMLAHRARHSPTIKPAVYEGMCFVGNAVSLAGDNIPANKIHWPNTGFMLSHRLRRWPNIRPILVQYIVSGRRQCGHSDWYRMINVTVWHLSAVTIHAEETIILRQRRWSALFGKTPSFSRPPGVYLNITRVENFTIPQYEIQWWCWNIYYYDVAV